MILSPSLMRIFPNIRLLVICFAAFSVSLPMAWISLAKVLLFVTGMFFLTFQLFNSNKDKPASSLWSNYTVLMSVMLFAASLSWSAAAPDIALLAFVKHSKLLEVLILIGLIRSEREARLGVFIFLLGQALFLASSWAMVAGWHIPWASSAWETVPQYKYVVYSTYLDQSILFATSAAIAWHLRPLWPRLRHLGILLAVMAATNTLFLLDGRTGYTVTLTMITMAVVWAIPKKLRLLAALLVPLMILMVAYFGSNKVSQRLTSMVSESQNYAQQGSSESSSGFRLNAWKRSLEAIAANPVTGHGVGSWTVTIKRLEGPSAQKVFGEGNASNPHQEYLLWGVELGVLGVLLLLAIFAAAAQDAMSFVPPVMRATLSLLAAAAVACLFNSTLYDALVGDYFCVALGLLMALGIQTNSGHRNPMPRATA